MASISRDAAGRVRIKFVAADKKRKAIWLGTISDRDAEMLLGKVEALLTAVKLNRPVDQQTAVWLADLSGPLAEKLAKAGLIPKPQSATLAGFIDRYIHGRTDVKPGTVLTYYNVRRNLVDFFGPDKPLCDITPGDAAAWRIWLKTHEGLAESSIRTRCKVAKQYGWSAVEHRLIPESPFAKLKSASHGNETRFYFITQQEAQEVLEACPNAEWRLLFALSRYGGLRCPSEHLRLRWADVDWDRDRFTVHAAKTEHQEHGGIRVVPIFPELRPYFDEVWEQAEPGAEFVITSYRDSGKNLRTQLTRIIRRAGLEPWPKLWQNLRSSRQTELTQQHPLHVVCAWIGNTAAVAAKHYLQVTDADYKQALTPKLTQYGIVGPRTGQNASPFGDIGNSETADFPANTTVYDCVHPPLLGDLSDQLGPVGFEPTTNRL